MNKYSLDAPLGSLHLFFFYSFNSYCPFPVHVFTEIHAKNYTQPCLLLATVPTYKYCDVTLQQSRSVLKLSHTCHQACEFANSYHQYIVMYAR